MERFHTSPLTLPPSDDFSAYFAALRTLVRPTRARDLPRTLEPMHRLLESLRNPEQAYPIVMVAGSVGKGSIALEMARMLSARGLRTGLYTSPHLHSFRERFAIEGRWIAPGAFASLADAVETASRAISYRPATFEAATALCYLWFRQESVDIAVCEIGLGGRYDAVNAAPNVLALLTPVEMEHAAMLGGTLESIAWHKAGIMRTAAPAISLPQHSTVRRVFTSEAAAIGSLLQFVDDDRSLIRSASQQPGLPRARASEPDPWPATLPGRMERFTRGNRIIWIDGAHTATAARRLADRLISEGDLPTQVIAALLRDKSPADVLRPFDRPGWQITLTTLTDGRGADACEAASLAALRQARVSVQPDAAQALAAVLADDSGRVVITGSLRLAARARELLGIVDETTERESTLTRAVFDEHNRSQS